MPTGGESEAPFENGNDQEEPKDAVAEDGPAARGEDQFAGADGERGDDRPGAEKPKPAQRIGGPQSIGDGGNALVGGGAHGQDVSVWGKSGVLDFIVSQRVGPVMHAQGRAGIKPAARFGFRFSCSIKERKQGFELGRGGLGAVFADFEHLGVFDFGSLFGAIGVFELIAVLVGDAGVDHLERGRYEFSSAGLVFGDLVEPAGVPGVPFGELRAEGDHAIPFFLGGFFDVDGDVGCEGVGFFESVGVVEKDGVFFEAGSVGGEIRNGDHEGGVLDEDGGVSVVGVVIVGARGEDDVGLPIADQAGDGFSVFEGGHEFAVVIVEDDGFDAQDFGARFDFCGAPLGERSAGRFEMADVAVGDGDEFDFVASRRPHGRHAPGFEFAIVGMGPERDDAELAIVVGSES